MDFFRTEGQGRMINRVCVISLLLCAFLFCIYRFGFAEVDLQKQYAEFTAEKYPEDSWMLLLEEMTVFLKEDGSYEMRLYELHKILKDEAKDYLGEKVTTYDANLQEIEIVKARSISPDGVVRESKEIQDIDLYKPYPAYSNYKVKVTTIPGLVRGSLIEYEVFIKARHSYIKGHYWCDWGFAYYYPMVESRFQIKIPANLTLNYRESKIDFGHTETLTEDKKYKIYRWARKGYKKQDLEEYMPTPFEAYSELAVSTISSWDYLASWGWDLFKDALVADAAIKKQVSKIVRGKKEKKERAAAIFKYVQDNIRYVALNFGDHLFKPHPPGEILKNKYGDCKDQSVLLITMLKEIGVEAWPALVHFELDGPIELRSVGPGFFQHVIVCAKLDNQVLWLDPTSKGYKFSDLPYALCSSKVLVLDGKKAHFEDLPEPTLEMAKGTVNSEFKVVQDGSIEGRHELIYNYPSSAGMRISFKEFSQKDKEEFKNALCAIISPGAKIKEFIHSDPEDFDEPFKVTFRYHSPDYASVMGNFMMLPIPMYGSYAIFSFSKEERFFPIVIRDPMMKVNRYVYNIPPGYRVKFVPEDSTLKMPLGGYSLSTEVDEKNGKVTVETKFWIERKEIPPSEYSKIKSYYAQVSKVFRQQILLEKILE